MNKQDTPSSPAPVHRLVGRMFLTEYFNQLRFDTEHHLGMGDIRITPGQQQEIIDAIYPPNSVLDGTPPQQQLGGERPNPDPGAA